MQDLLSLDDLFKEAKRHLRAEAEAKAKAPVKPKAPSGSLYGAPENWVHSHYTSLIHATSRSALGVFQVLLHRTMPDCRRLVRAEGYVPTATEEVSGTWDFLPAKLPEHTPSSLRTYNRTLSISLSSPDCSAEGVDLRIIGNDSGILQVQLVSPTTFAAPGVFLYFPADTNILPILSHPSKVTLKESLNEY